MQVAERCDECGGVIDPEVQECKNCGKHFGNKKRATALGVVIAIILATVVFCAIVFLPAKKADLPNTSKDSVPENGQIFDLPRRGLTAPFCVWTSKKGGYYFTLVSRQTGAVEMSFYVHGGENIQIPVPVGEYDVYYASGTEWVSKESLFGPNTEYYSVKETYVFKSFQTVAQNLDVRPTSDVCADIEKISAMQFPRK